MSVQRDNFQILVSHLVQTIKDWVQPVDWVTRTYPKKMRDNGREVFEIPALYLQKGPTRVLLDPIAFDVPGADAVVDLYLMPTYDDIATLYFKRGAWVIHYEFPKTQDPSHHDSEASFLPLSKESINLVLNAIEEHAIPSF
jgi:hypothetical protein